MKSYFSLFNITLLIFNLFFLKVAPAQSDFSASLSGGVTFYNGDLGDKNFIPPLKLLSPGYGLEFTAMIVNRLELSLSYSHGSVSGDDAYSSSSGKKIRNLSFNSVIDEFAFKFRLEFFKTNDFRPVNSYLAAGLGFFRFNPKAELNGDMVALQPLGTEGQFIDEPGYESPYKLVSTALLVGVGMRITLTDRFALLAEVVPRFTFTDYLDDVSGYYPDSSSLAATQNGQLAVQMANQTGLLNFPAKGRPRGNPDFNDVYISAGIAFRYYFGSLYSAGQKPGIYRRMARGKSGWWGSTIN
jgi:hypothetical protein